MRQGRQRQVTLTLPLFLKMRKNETLPWMFLRIPDWGYLRFTCRQCEDAPCISVCPVDALEKDSSGVLTRASNLCVACKSCVTICPFGTMLNSFFEVRKSICNYCHLNGNFKKLLCVETCKEQALTITDKDETPNENIHRLNDKILVKEYIWEKLKHE